MDKKGICIITKNIIEALNFQALLEAKTNVRWKDGSLPTQVNLGYEIFCIEPNLRSKLNVLTGATYEQLREDKFKDYGFFKDLTSGEYDIYIL